MSDCPYRMFHEYDKDGLCKHCYQPMSKSLPSLETPRPDVSPLANLSCSIAGCTEPGALLVRITDTKWSTRCRKHQKD